MGTFSCGWIPDRHNSIWHRQSEQAITATQNLYFASVFYWGIELYGPFESVEVDRSRVKIPIPEDEAKVGVCLGFDELKNGIQFTCLGIYIETIA